MSRPRRPLRLFALTSLAVLAGALAIPAPRAATASSSAPPLVTTFARAGEAHPWLLEGALASASTRPAEVVAREVMSLHAPWSAAYDLVAAGTVTVGRGVRVVGFSQRIDGVPVFSRGVRVRVEPDGRATTLATALEELRPKTMLASLSGADAERVAPLAAAHRKATRIVWPTGGEPRLAWLVEGATEGLPTRPVAVVDAELGTVLARWDAARALDLARVYPQNPVKTPTLTEVTLPADAAPLGLANAHVIAKNCIDNKTLTPANVGQQVNLHVCDLIPTVAPDANGDYTSITPPSSDTAPQDSFSELSMFFHANTAWDAAKAMGFAPADVTAPIYGIANFRMNKGLETGSIADMQNPNLALAPYDNAFFAPGGYFGAIFGEDGDALWFGQGTRVDFSYDGDVVYHEFGHFVVDHTARLVATPHRDAYGITYAPGAMNEGIADLFSCFITGDPYVGEYAGRGLTGGPIRELDGTSSFPQTLSGEVHQDSLPFSQPIWLAYAALDASHQEAFRRAFLETLATAPTGDLGYYDLAQLLEAAITKELDAATAKSLDDAFRARGIVPDDPRVIDSDGSPMQAGSWLGYHAASRGGGGLSPFAPGIFQLRYETRVGSYSLHITWDYMQSQSQFGSAGLDGSSGKYAPEVLVKIGTSPISFQYGPLRYDAQLVACDDLGGTVDCTVPVDVVGQDDAGFGVAYVMPVNSGTLEVDLNNLAIETPRAPWVADAGSDARADGGDSGATPAGDAASHGCGCAQAGARGGDPLSRLSAASVLALVGLVVRRRRRERAPSRCDR